MSKETFLDKMNKATKVKVKLPHSSKTVQIPRSAVRQARDLAIKLVCYEERCSKQEIEKNPAKYDGKLEGAFRGYLEGYAESVIPASNPGGRHRARAAIANFEDTLTGKDGYWKASFPKDSDDKREQRNLVFKSGVMKLSDAFLEGTMKVAPQSIGDGTLPQDMLGLNFTSDMKKPIVQKVVTNRYAQLMAVTMILTLLERFFRVRQATVDNYLLARLGNKTLGELLDKNNQDQFVEELKVRARGLLADADLEKILR